MSAYTNDGVPLVPTLQLTLGFFRKMSGTKIQKKHAKNLKSVTYFRQPLEVGLKLAIKLGHLAKGETYMYLQYHWPVGGTTICKYVLVIYWVVLAEFQEEYMTCPTNPEDCKKVEKLRTRWNIPTFLRH